MKVRYLVAAVGLVVGAAVFWRAAPVNAQTAAAPAAQAPEPPPTPVEIATAESRTIAPSQWVPGTVVSKSDARIGSELPGRLTWIAEVGDTVAAGDALAKLDTDALKIELRQDQAELERLRVQTAHAGRQVERLEAMGAKSAVAVSQLDETRMNRDVLQQQLARAEADLADSRRRLKDGVIRAPFAGTVAERMANVGEVVGSTPLLRLVDTQNLEVQARAPAQAALNLKAGAAVQLRSGSDAAIAMKLRAVVPVGDSGSRQLELRVALDEARWPVGTAVQVAVPEREAHAGIAVPRDALLIRGNETYVFRVGADGKAQKVVVTTGDAEGDRIEVLGGIAHGDALVVRGGERLREGQKVKVLESGVAG